MNIAPDPKSIPQGTLLSPEANQAAALVTATGVLTVDLDAIVANWRKLEKTAVWLRRRPGRARPLWRRLQDVFRRHPR